MQKGPLDSATRLRFLAALIDSSDFDEAVRLSGVSRAALFAERARDAIFALEWDRMTDHRFVEIEARLVDRLAAGLKSDRSGSDSREKLLLAVAQWCMEARLSNRYGKSRPAAAGGTPSPAPSDEEDAEARVKALLERAQQRLAEIEAGAADQV